MEKLTNEEIARVFAMYWGATIIRKGGGKDKVYGLSISHLEEFAILDDAQLLLTPLSSISDEHALVIGRMYNYHLVDNEKNKRLIIDAGKMLSKVGLNSDYRIVQYLLQQGYAVTLFFGVGHWANGKTAIELRIAIESPTP